ncbi:MAG: sigma-54-dependent Fis family transcriptional regulator [Desulfobacteraceae bacterium]|nr:MAG: sigma-54-dependent Fis family transcriptional regulator [Desulfobacteraceae bacterium]
MEKILLIDDDEGLIHFLTRFFQRKRYAVTACLSGREAIDVISKQSFDLILLDYKMPDLNGLDTLLEIKKLEAKTPVILMTAYGTTDLAIEAMKLGAYDYLVKPFEHKDLTHIVGEALKTNQQMKEIVRFPAATFPFAVPQDRRALNIVGNSKKMQEIYKLIGQIAEKDVSVLITGETGTGKELVARAIYHHSRRREAPFIAINCAAIPEYLFESELFGHERGAFTGAERTYIGKIERCDNGTLFLDEIGEMPLALQAKLLRALQNGEIERIGGSHTINVNVRILAATNKDIEKEVEGGRFRKDLYWRLKVISIDIPPLRQRSEDIPALVEYFLSRFSAEYNRPLCFMSEAAIKKMTSYSWPGNVREIENCVRRAVLLSAGGVIDEGNLMIPDPQEELAAQEMNHAQLVERLKQKIETIIPDILRLSNRNINANIIEMVEDTLVRAALNECVNNQVQAAKILGISRNTLRQRLKRHADRDDNNNEHGLIKS